MAGKIPRLVYSVDPNNENLRIYCENRHTTTFQRNLDQGVRFAFPGDRADLPPAIAPGIAPGGIPPDVFNFLGTSIARQAEALEAITTTNENTLNFQRDKENKKKDRFNKFHPNVKQMILWASAVDNEDVPTVPEDTCERFMNAISQGIAEQELSMQFKSMDLGEVAYATGLTLNLYNGNSSTRSDTIRATSAASLSTKAPTSTKKNSRTANSSSTSSKPKGKDSPSKK